MDNHEAFGVLKNIARGREWHGRNEEIGDIQGWVLWSWLGPGEPKILEDLARHRGEKLFDECNSDSGRIQPVRLRWS